MKNVNNQPLLEYSVAEISDFNQTFIPLRNYGLVEKRWHPNNPYSAGV